MKKSEMTVSMPMTTFDEYESYKEKYINLVNSLSQCFDASLKNIGAQTAVVFDAKKALAVCKGFMPLSIQSDDVEITV